MALVPSRRLVEFHAGSGTDAAGRTFEGVLMLDDVSLERVHDYIQWLFPTFTQSAVVPDAPTLDMETVTAIRESQRARQRMLAATQRMLRFYGLQLDNDPDEPSVDKALNWEQRRANWISPGNHNYRRLTRMLISLQILGHAALAGALFEYLENIYREHGGRIGSAVHHWRAAMKRA